MYTTYHPETKDRRAVRDIDGNITNEGQFTKFGDFKKGNRELTVQPDGHVEYAVVDMRRLKKPLTPYQKFTKVVLAPFWDVYKETIPKPRRMVTYGIVKKYIWNELKSQVYWKILESKYHNQKPRELT